MIIYMYLWVVAIVLVCSSDTQLFKMVEALEAWDSFYTVFLDGHYMLTHHYTQQRSNMTEVFWHHCNPQYYYQNYYWPYFFPNI